MEEGTIEFVQVDIVELTGGGSADRIRPIHDGPYSAVYRGRWNNEEVAVKAIRTAGTLKRPPKTSRRILDLGETSTIICPPNVWACLDGGFGEYGHLGASTAILQNIYNSFWTSPESAFDCSLKRYKVSTISAPTSPSSFMADILIDSTGTAKLCDCGLIRLIHEEHTGMTSTTVHTGTTRYLSKELLSRSIQCQLRLLTIMLQAVLP
ncbi:hypothetical protein FRB91_011386 [Serendipita sp. 411]|nr:hypothetical protein FRC18_005276 [Serendipita sp. 400]KAG8847841.1 hypothetical protein FRB91_011386 [Serendipita sp. 411]